jgi:hypothetical protein
MDAKRRERSEFGIPRIMHSIPTRFSFAFLPDHSRLANPWLDCHEPEPRRADRVGLRRLWTGVVWQGLRRRCQPGVQGRFRKSVVAIMRRPSPFAGRGLRCRRSLVRPGALKSNMLQTWRLAPHRGRDSQQFMRGDLQNPGCTLSPLGHHKMGWVGSHESLIRENLKPVGS